MKFTAAQVPAIVSGFIGAAVRLRAVTKAEIIGARKSRCFSKKSISLFKDAAEKKKNIRGSLREIAVCLRATRC